MEKERKSSSNIEEVYSEDGFEFEEESLGNSQLNAVSTAKAPVVGAGKAGSNWASTNNKPVPAANKSNPDGSSNLDDFSDANAFEDKYDDDDFL